MIRAAIVNTNGLVENVIVLSSLEECQGAVMCPDQVGIGMPLDTPEPVIPVVVPSSVTMRQARLALLQSGYLEQVNAILAGMTGVEGEAARIEWEYAQEVVRESPLVQGLAAALPLTEGELDQLFTLAGGL